MPTVAISPHRPATRGNGADEKQHRPPTRSSGATGGGSTGRSTSQPPPAIRSSHTTAGSSPATIALVPSLPEWNMAGSNNVVATGATRKPTTPGANGNGGGNIFSRPQTRDPNAYTTRARSQTSGSRPVSRDRLSSTAVQNGGASRPVTRGRDAVSAQDLKVRAREKIYDINLVSQGMPAYEPLLDGFLQDHFNTPSIRAHLTRLGIIDEDGYIVDEREFQHLQLRMDRAEREIRLEMAAEQRDLDREVEVVVRHAGDPEWLATATGAATGGGSAAAGGGGTGGNRGAAAGRHEKWSSAVEKYTRSLLPPVRGTERRISPASSPLHIAPGGAATEPVSAGGAAMASPPRHRTESSKDGQLSGATRPTTTAAGTKATYEDDFDDTAGGAAEQQPTSSVRIAAAPSTPSKSSKDELSSHHPTANEKQQPSAAAGNKQPKKVKLPTDAEVQTYRAKLHAITPTVPLTDDSHAASVTCHRDAKALCTSLMAKYSSSVLEKAHGMRSVLAEAALLWAKAAHAVHNEDDTEHATQLAFRNVVGLPALQNALVEWRHGMTASPTHGAHTHPAGAAHAPQTPPKRKTDHTTTPDLSEFSASEMLLIQQIAALDGDVQFAIDKIRGLRAAAAASSASTRTDGKTSPAVATAHAAITKPAAAAEEEDGKHHHPPQQHKPVEEGSHAAHRPQKQQHEKAESPSAHHLAHAPAAAAVAGAAGAPGAGADDHHKKEHSGHQDEHHNKNPAGSTHGLAAVHAAEPAPAPAATPAIAAPPASQPIAQAPPPHHEQMPEHQQQYAEPCHAEPTAPPSAVAGPSSSSSSTEPGYHADSATTVPAPAPALPHLPLQPQEQHHQPQPQEEQPQQHELGSVSLSMHLFGSKHALAPTVAPAAAATTEPSGSSKHHFMHDLVAASSEKALEAEVAVHAAVHDRETSGPSAAATDAAGKPAPAVGVSASVEVHASNGHHAGVAASRDIDLNFQGTAVVTPVAAAVVVAEAAAVAAAAAVHPEKDQQHQKQQQPRSQSQYLLDIEFESDTATTATTTASTVTEPHAMPLPMSIAGSAILSRGGSEPTVAPSPAAVVATSTSGSSNHGEGPATLEPHQVPLPMSVASSQVLGKSRSVTVLPAAAAPAMAKAPSASQLNKKKNKNKSGGSREHLKKSTSGGSKGHLGKNRSGAASSHVMVEAHMVPLPASIAGSMMLQFDPTPAVAASRDLPAHDQHALKDEEHDPHAISLPASRTSMSSLAVLNDKSSSFPSKTTTTAKRTQSQQSLMSRSLTGSSARLASTRKSQPSLVARGPEEVPLPASTVTTAPVSRAASANMLGRSSEKGGSRSKLIQDDDGKAAAGVPLPASRATSQMLI